MPTSCRCIIPKMTASPDTIRTTAEGTANAYTDLKGKDLESYQLSTEEADGYEIPRPKEVAA